MEEQHILSAALIVGETLLMTGFSNALMVILILSGINLSIFLLLNLQYIQTAAPQISCVPDVKNKVSLISILCYLIYISEVI